MAPEAMTKEFPITPAPHEGTASIWHEFRAGQERAHAPGIRARITLTQPMGDHRQFVVETGSGHHLIVDDATGATGAKPIELVAAALAGCTAFDVITVLRNKKHQHVTGYEVRVEADRAERPPQVFVAVPSIMWSKECRSIPRRLTKRSESRRRNIAPSRPC
jgi:uncharacterized OsmC-like protein